MLRFKSRTLRILTACIGISTMGALNSIPARAMWSSTPSQVTSFIPRASPLILLRDDSTSDR